jgi:hypothetical protein
MQFNHFQSDFNVRLDAQWIGSGREGFSTLARQILSKRAGTFCLHLPHGRDESTQKFSFESAVEEDTHSGDHF